MLDSGQYDYNDRHQMLQQEYRESVLFQRALIKQVRQASNQVGAWLVKVGEQIQQGDSVFEFDAEQS